MKNTKEQLEKMQEYVKNYLQDEYMDIYWLKRLYNDFSDEFWLDIAFWVDGCEYWWDDSLYCYIHVNDIWSIVYNRSVNRYDDINFYKDCVNYLLELNEEWKKIKEKLLNLNQK